MPCMHACLDHLLLLPLAKLANSSSDSTLLTVQLLQVTATGTRKITVLPCKCYGRAPQKLLLSNLYSLQVYTVTRRIVPTPMLVSQMHKKADNTNHGEGHCTSMTIVELFSTWYQGMHCTSMPSHACEHHKSLIQNPVK
jgi:hypothetical protein